MARVFSLRPQLTALCVAGCFVAGCLALAASAQAPVSTGPAGTVDFPELDSILTRLDQNVQDYRKTVPSFLCNEHAVSRAEPGPGMMRSMQTTTDAVFRVRRGGKDSEPTVNESRVVKLIDGKPPTDAEAKLDSPMTVFGIFSYGLRLVSADNRMCFRYRLRPARKGHEAEKLTIDFDELPLKERGNDCPGSERLSGRATIDPQSMRVVRLEAKELGYELFPSIKGTWDWSIDYAPVTLSGKSFWMPATIRSQAESEGRQTAISSGGNSSGRRGGGGSSTITDTGKPPLTYSLLAKYSDYHLLNVTSKILIPGKSSADDPDAADEAEPGAAAPKAPVPDSKPPENAPGP